MQTFQNKRLAYAVKESTLDSLITELLLWLLDERVPHMDDGSHLLKALNVLMLKILVKTCHFISSLFFFSFILILTRMSYFSLICYSTLQDNTDRTSSFIVLINLLRPLDPSRWPSPASNETFAVKNQKFSDLVVKCLIKLTKEGNVANQREHLVLLLANIHIHKANKQSVLKVF
ncbi:protein MOR1-like [Humulus lupulus]|uniref:protein MOR1-like n=1 Tax=Humulus lupulus TaxID=3486 RepID=UPI002B41526A|nr:protein MOR1-like [Humulus lupulus]